MSEIDKDFGMEMMINRVLKHIDLSYLVEKLEVSENILKMWENGEIPISIQRKSQIKSLLNM